MYCSSKPSQIDFFKMYNITYMLFLLDNQTIINKHISELDLIFMPNEMYLLL